MRLTALATIFLSTLILAGYAQLSEAAVISKLPPPNILFFVMDDVGIDQMKVFGYGGDNPPQTPNIDAVALAGIRFRNTWSQPTCSPTRATFFDGRYP
ncbi:MAG: sulfatase-like hydrolase/transferase, partial [Methylococcales bacterium]|nr:sulfatase-like hydrolase/transferase [Methylococcales bacterium]